MHHFINGKKKRYINSDFQYTILWPEGDIDNLNFKELIKNNNLKNISEEDLKNNLINKYRDFVKAQKNVSTFYLSCTNCSTTYFLEPETIIDSINFESLIKSLVFSKFE